MRYGSVHDRRETERRGRVKQKSLADLALTKKVSAFFIVKEALLSGISDIPFFLFIKTFQYTSLNYAIINHESNARLERGKG